MPAINPTSPWTSRNGKPQNGFKWHFIGSQGLSKTSCALLPQMERTVGKRLNIECVLLCIPIPWVAFSVLGFGVDPPSGSQTLEYASRTSFHLDLNQRAAFPRAHAPSSEIRKWFLFLGSTPPSSLGGLKVSGAYFDAMSSTAILPETAL